MRQIVRKRIVKIRNQHRKMFVLLVVLCYFLFMMLVAKIIAF